MAPPTFLSISLDVRYMILELLLVSESPIKPHLMNHTKGNSTTPNLTNISRTCAQLRQEAKFVFFSRNEFFFDVPSTVFGQHNPLKVASYFSKQWLSSFKASETKLLLQNITISYVQKQDWYNQNVPCPWHDNDSIKQAMEALPSCKSVRKLELLIVLPPCVYLCDKHFSMHQKQHNLPQVPREEISGVWSKWCYSEVSYERRYGRKQAELHIEDMEPFGVEGEIGGKGGREPQGEGMEIACNVPLHFAKLEELRESKLATIKFKSLDDGETFERMEDHHKDKPWSAILSNQCSWHQLQFIRESIKRMEVGGNMEQLKEELKVFGLNARKSEMYERPRKITQHYEIA